MSLDKVRRAVDLELARAGPVIGGDIPDAHIAAVLIVLDSLHLLRQIDEDPAEYIDRVHLAHARAWREVTRGRALRGL